MGRTKQSRPIKRRRVILEADDSVVAEEQTTLMEHQHREELGGVKGENELAIAIDLLRKTPPDRVEAAAAEATRSDLARSNRWIHLRPPKILLSPSPTTTSAIMFNEYDNSHIGRETSTQGSHNNASVIKGSIPANSCSGSNEATVHTIEDAASTNTSENTLMFSSRIPSWARGLGFARLAAEDFHALQQLHQLIKNRINRKSSGNNDGTSSSSDVEWASWSGSIEDPRKRAFVFLPGTWGYDSRIRNNRLDITMPQTDLDDDSRNNERIRNKRAMLVLEKSEVPEGVERAIKNLCEEFRQNLLPKEKDNHTIMETDSSDFEYRTHLAEFLRYDYMIAAQPNLHSGRSLLPVHLDDPKKDGFGVVILTIGMEGAGTILLRDGKGIHRGVAMRLESGDAYMLSDRARDSCLHGVLADGFITTRNGEPSNIPSSERESLNLRFGLHDLKPPCGEANASPIALVPSSVVFKHWG